MKKTLFPVLLAGLLTVAASGNASAQFDVNWGTSSDNGNAGYTDLGAWFFNNGYSADQAAGEAKAKTGYVGFGAADNDAFFFNGPSAKFEAVARNAGNAAQTTFGYYTGQGLSKSLTQVLAPLANGPVNAAINGNFGLYIETPAGWQSDFFARWYTDRTENNGPQQNAPHNPGGDPQALIYSLSPSEWLVAWEDLDYTKFSQGNSDRDFNDLYVKVTVTPEPASMLLFGLGMGALGLAGIRRKQI